MAGKIFINYRRGDDPGNTGRLFDHLEKAFPGRLFMDVESMSPGADFVRVLDAQVAQCDVLLAVIGKDWIDARDGQGRRRLDLPNDFVRIELESAFRQGKLVIPVLVHGAPMPEADRLPDSIQRLHRCNAVRLTHERFNSDTQGLVKSLRRQLKNIDYQRRIQAKGAKRASLWELVFLPWTSIGTKEEANGLVHVGAVCALIAALLCALAGFAGPFWGNPPQLAPISEIIEITWGYLLDPHLASSEWWGWQAIPFGVAVFFGVCALAIHFESTIAAFASFGLLVLLWLIADLPALLQYPSGVIITNFTMLAQIIAALAGVRGTLAVAGLENEPAVSS